MKYQLEEAPSGCSRQIDGLRDFDALAKESVHQIVSHFRLDIDSANDLLSQSCDKRFTPSTYLEEVSGRYKVGWYDESREHERSFSDLAEAAADYLLFSFGRGRLGRRSHQGS